MKGVWMAGSTFKMLAQLDEGKINPVTPHLKGDNNLLDTSDPDAPRLKPGAGMGSKLAEMLAFSCTQQHSPMD
jgi:hypothetical protein